MKKVVAIYHKDCNDGTTAAAVVLKKFTEAKLFPLSHLNTKEETDLILENLDSDTDIYTVDCVLLVKEMLSLGYRVTSLDHHIGVRDEFNELANKNKDFTYIFDNNKSGSSITWDYFFPDIEKPEFIKLVEDSDLFILKYTPDTDYISNYVSMFRNNPEAVLGFLNGNLDEIKKKGEAITVYVNEQIKEQVKTPPITLKIGDHQVPAYNLAQAYRSACGNILSSRQNKAVALFSIMGDTAKVSFRSKDGQKPNALELAKILGGGGHNNASSSFIPLSDFISMIQK